MHGVQIRLLLVPRVTSYMAFLRPRLASADPAERRHAADAQAIFMVTHCTLLSLAFSMCQSRTTTTLRDIHSPPSLAGTACKH